MADLARRSSGEAVVSGEKRKKKASHASSYRLPQSTPTFRRPEAGVRRGAWAEVTGLRQAAPSSLGQTPEPHNEHAILLPGVGAKQAVLPPAE